MTWQDDVVAFHQAMGLAVGDEPALRASALRADLIREEADETIQAIDVGDLPAAVDGLIDLIYVAIGAAVTWGVDLAPIWDAVHAANMAKSGGRKRADGKQLKPAGWRPPDVASLIEEQRREYEDAVTLLTPLAERPNRWDHQLWPYD
jgi:predicted HAD superfamily Cof-like phosphohydrolase